VTAAATKRSPGRPPTPPEQAEAEQLHQIVELAHQILIALRKDRGSYASERELRMLLTDNGIAFSNDDVTLAPWIYWSRWESLFGLQLDSVLPASRPSAVKGSRGRTGRLRGYGARSCHCPDQCGY
jgi:hypothetical protein